jgi:molybdopterin-containing oxidoreductase family iron-sulfur binding subunit
VEKCNFCAERLGVGKIPACVEVSHEIAGKRGDKPMLYFGDLEDPHSEVRELVGSHHTIRRKSHLGTMPQVYYIL